MCTLCTSCDISGSETLVASGITLDECKSKCLSDRSCKGIDFGKGRRAGVCYLNYGWHYGDYAWKNTDFGYHGYFDGYSKKYDCGNLFFHYHKLKFEPLLNCLCAVKIKLLLVFYSFSDDA